MIADGHRGSNRAAHREVERNHAVAAHRILQRGGVLSALGVSLSVEGVALARANRFAELRCGCGIHGNGDAIHTRYIAASITDLNGINSGLCGCQRI